ncbi:MAG TPA: peptide-methionine (R)-S-oxide reductase, partial [Sphingorhabdus lacus]|nr:peptide-methionine (R)-S-oxide reductase [Sphingorhabdus lacus]
MKLSKRQFFSLGSIGVAAFMFGCGKDATAKARFAVTLTDAEWKKRLSPAAYRVLRQEDTETPFTSPLNKEKRKGTFVCAGCNQRL